MKTRAIDILLVEDNPGDVELIRSTLRKADVETQITIGRDGVEAISILHEKLASPPLPDLILLDLNLPKKNGKDVLSAVKCHSRLKSIPVIVLTSSAAPDDISAAYDLGANCYLTKSIDTCESDAIMKSLEDFWFQCVHLPDRTPVALAGD